MEILKIEASEAVTPTTPATLVAQPAAVPIPAGDAS